MDRAGADGHRERVGLTMWPALLAIGAAFLADGDDLVHVTWTPRRWTFKQVSAWLVDVVRVMQARNLLSPDDERDEDFEDRALDPWSHGDNDLQLDELPSDVLDLLDKNGIEFLGEGRTRVVFRIGKRVVKVAKNYDGIVANEREIERWRSISKNKRLLPLFAPVLDSEEMGRWVAMPYAASVDYTQNIYLQKHAFEDALRDLPEDDDLLHELDRLDLTNRHNYGTLNGRVVIVDYGN